MYTTGYADGIFTQGGAPRYGYGQQVNSYADGALGCSSCSGMGATPQLTDQQWKLLFANMQAQQMQSQAAMLPTSSTLPRTLLIAGGVAGVALVAYLVFSRKKG